MSHRRWRASTRAPKRCASPSRWPASRQSCMKTARRQAREIALQALYAWQLSGSDPVEQARGLEGFDKTDASFVNALAAHPETPFKVVLNEAIELGKSFGATDGYRFVNGVLEKIAAALRPDEVARSRKIA